MVKNINKNNVLLRMLSLGMLCAIPNLEAMTLRYLKRSTLLNPIASIRSVSDGIVPHFSVRGVQYFSPTTQWDENKHKSTNIEIHNLDQQRFWRLANEQLSKNYPLPYLGDKKIILLLGATGVGKSTFVNRMLGYKSYWESAGETERKSDKQAEYQLDFLQCEYDEEKTIGPKKLAMEENLDIKQRAEIGNSTESCTKVPQVYELSEDLVLVDCPGFGNTEQIEQKILDMLMIQLLVEKSKKVSAVMCFISYEKSLGGAGKGEDFLYLARQLGYLFSFEEYIANIFWCFTIYPDGMQIQHVVAQLEALKKEKLALKDKLMDQIWHRSQEKKDAILMEKLLEHRDNIMLISPFMNDKKVEKLKNFLATKINGCIEKEGFMFHYPGLDIKSTAKEFFAEKREVAIAYENRSRLAAMILEKEAKKQGLEDILKDESNLAKYIVHATKTIIQDIASLEKEVDNQTQEIARKEAVKDDLSLYREEIVELKAGWLNCSKQIIYNDFPFEKTEEVYVPEHIQRNLIEYEPNRGVYKVEFTVAGVLNKASKMLYDLDPVIALVLINSAAEFIASAAPAKTISFLASSAYAVGKQLSNFSPYSVKVVFYVKNKYTQSVLVEGLERKLVLDQSKLEKLKKKKESIEPNTIDDLKNQCENILPAEINECQARIAENERILNEQEIPLSFMVEVYPLLYPGVDDELNGFAAQHKDTLQLFAKPQSATGNDGDDTKEDDTN